MKILFFGDIFGRPGREAIKKVLPELLHKYKPDFVIANVENIAHGKGITEGTLGELEELGVFHAYTSGNHVWAAPVVKDILKSKRVPLLRPINYPQSDPGAGFLIVESGVRRLLVINALGRVFMKDNYLEDPFSAINKVLQKYTLDSQEDGKEKVDAIFVDFHAEATSEKRALAFYLDGRVSAVVGTHTHVPTADAQILPKGSAYISDAGFVGPYNSSLGVDVQIIIEEFLTQISQRKEVSQDASAEIGAVIIDIKKDGTAKDIKHIRKIIKLA